MATSTGFPAEEIGTGSRPTPVVDSPAWLQHRAAGGDRPSLTAVDRAFLDSAPSYDETTGSLLASLSPAPAPAPSMARSVLSKLLFVVIAGSASAVLVLALLRMLGHAISR